MFNRICKYFSIRIRVVGVFKSVVLSSESLVVAFSADSPFFLNVRACLQSFSISPTNLNLLAISSFSLAAMDRLLFLLADSSSV